MFPCLQEPSCCWLGLNITFCCMRAGIVVIDRKKDKVDRKDGKDNIVVSRK